MSRPTHIQAAGDKESGDPSQPPIVSAAVPLWSYGCDAHFRAACQQAARFFAPEFSVVVRRLVPGNYGVAGALLHTVFVSISDEEGFYREPASIAEFIAATDGIFSDEVHETLIDRAIAFNKVSGLDKAGYAVSDILIREHSIHLWIFKIINVIAAHCLKVAAAEQTADHRAAGLDVAQTTREAAPHVPTPTSAISTEAGGSSTTTAAEDPSATTAPATCPIVQIDLEGHTILEGWVGNFTLDSLEKDASADAEFWDPSSQRNLPVYHGTHHHISEDLGEAWPARRTSYELRTQSRQHFHQLRGHTNLNQVAPALPSLKVAWTGFSPLRCFLWAAFRSDVIPNGVIRRTPEELDKKWPCPEHGQHSGVVLLKFRPLQPAPPGLNWYLMPRGREAAWRNLCREITERTDDPDTPTDTLWGRFHDFHGGNPSTWPQVLHCREFGDQARMLSDFTNQLWRTVWTGEGIQELNRSHEATFAISFTPTASPEAPETPSFMCTA